MFNSGFRPAVNAGLSVSRVGGAAQIKAMKKFQQRQRLPGGRAVDDEPIVCAGLIEVQDLQKGK